MLGQGPGEVVISGPDTRQMERLASDLRELLDSIPEVGQAWVRGRAGQDEIRVTPDPVALAGWGLTPDQVLPSLSLLRREGVTLRVGWTLPDGREIPLTVRRKEDAKNLAGSEIENLRLATPAGVVPVGALATARVMPPPPTILHHNGRRELSVYYRLAGSAPSSGPARRSLDDRIQTGVREVHRPTGYTIEARGIDESTSWFKKALVPMLLLLFAVLAITFESLTLPVLVLVAVPLTVLGATWALVFSGMPADVMALVGVVALLGLTVNPAILLVDRMQRRVLTGSWTAGAAALAAVRERTRPVLMTTCTTLAGLWPLALSSGREMEIWPPFATVVMGGLATSTVLTLLVIPVGFVLLARLDRVFGRLGPWVMMAWLGATAAVMAPLILTEVISSTIWQAVTAVLVGGVLLGAAVLLFRRTTRPEPDTTEGPPVVVVRYLAKVYGRPGPVGRALRLGRDFASRVSERGGTPFVPREAWERAVTSALVLLGSGYLALNLQSVFWRLVFAMVSAAIIATALQEIRRARGCHDALGRALPGGVEGVLGAAAPWAVLTILALEFTILPRLAEEPYRLAPVGLILVATLVALVQLGRRTAVAVARGRVDERAERGLFQRPRTVWRRLCRRVFGLDLPREEVRALDTVHFRAERGMVGILGPNGAGKTTFLRLLAGILEPTGGAIRLGGVPLAMLRRYLARWVGYLPQDFGLPDDLTAREYLDYYALMYRTGKPAERAERINGLLEEVGLGERADDRIGGYSGGMRQRVAVARTLLRLPPVIIVDEPTVGLDPRERIRFRNLLARLARGRVVLFSTHVVEDVAVACERVIVLAHGQVVFDGQPARLAEAAEGRVWEVRLSPGDEEGLGPEVSVVDQVPEADGSVRTRVLSVSEPHPGARPAEPTLEDGYLALVGTRLSGSGAGSVGGL
jgi:ABC-type multidrug transport system ATPase subunit